MFALLSSNLSWCKGHIWCTQAQKNGTYYNGFADEAGFVKNPVRRLCTAKEGGRLVGRLYPLFASGSIHRHCMNQHLPVFPCNPQFVPHCVLPLHMSPSSFGKVVHTVRGGG